MSKRRVNQGEKNGRAKLSDRDALEIRQRYLDGEAVESIHRDYQNRGITLKAIKNICYYQTFTHLS